MSEPARVALLIVGTLALSVVLCLLLAGAVRMLIGVSPAAAPELSILLALVSLAGGYFGFRALVNWLFG